MPIFRVKIKYGELGSTKHSSQDVTVEANDELHAERMAINKFLTSNAAYEDKEAIAIAVKEIG